MNYEAAHRQWVSGSQELVYTLTSWRHPGFSVHVGDPIPPNDAKAIEYMARYVVRNPLSSKRLVHIDGPKVLAPQARGQKAVIYRALKPNPALGRNPSARFAVQDAHASSLWTRRSACGSSFLAACSGIHSREGGKLLKSSTEDADVRCPKDTGSDK